MTKAIFEKVFNRKIDQVQLWQHSHPKEITCKGGLLNDNRIDIGHIKTVLLGDSANTVIPKVLTNDSGINDTEIPKVPTNDSGINVTKIPKAITNYSDIDDAVIASVLEEVDRFITLFFSLDAKLDFNDKFGIKPSLLGQYKLALRDDLITKLKSELGRKRNELEEGREIKIDEPLFFYPLAGAIANLSNKITTQFK